MKLVFEQSVQGRMAITLPASNVPSYTLQCATRKTQADLSEISEIDLVRHYTRLGKQVYGVDNGFYPLGSCTMKYNPRLNEQVVELEGFNNVHPTQCPCETKGTIEVMTNMQQDLCAITGMDYVTLQPAAGAHGEFCGMLLIKKYHQSRGDTLRKKIIVPDSAHGTNPASANMCGFEIVTVSSNKEGGVDIDNLKQIVGPDTAGLMLTNPNTLGLFDKNILSITRIIHDAGGLCYYDGANLNAIMGMCRPGDMGFDCVHLNIHKTFSAPHGGGGPGSGPVGCKQMLAKFLPTPIIGKQPTVEYSLGKVKSYCGNFPVILRGYTYIKTLGSSGLKQASQLAVLNANYLRILLQQDYTTAIDRICMHEFVLDVKDYHDNYSTSALDISKTMIDYGMHPPTMYFPLIVHEALMFEPTETESKQTLEEVAEIMHKISIRAKDSQDDLHASPVTTPIGRVDEVKAARQPILKYQPQ
ncbi:MAG: aminomethyl-transferring glycine dehydrogenase subunit GcvPB [Clostridia bacterium]|nr:aminomethyl-transferring glycine dehydrogenase subunit GcvPB [Clostridia bacterium]